MRNWTSEGLTGSKRRPLHVKQLCGRTSLGSFQGNFKTLPADGPVSLLQQWPECAEMTHPVQTELHHSTDHSRGAGQGPWVLCSPPRAVQWLGGGSMACGVPLLWSQHQHPIKDRTFQRSLKTIPTLNPVLKHVLATSVWGQLMRETSKLHWSRQKKQLRW